MNFDFSKLHFNWALLVKELISRGISVRLIDSTNVVEANYNWHIEIIDDTDLSIMPSTYRYILDDKWKTKMILNDKWFDIIEWKVFECIDLENATKYACTIWFPVVIKPRSWTHGYYVRMNIDSKSEFEEIFEKLSKETSWMDLLVEKQIEWNEYRLTITNNWFFAVVQRSFPSVVWDWKSTIEELVNGINYKRVSNRINCLCRIWLDNEAKRYLSKKWLSINYIPKKWEEIVVRSNSNVSTWAECIDVTNFVDNYFKDIALKILASFPNLPYLWVDLITKDITQKWEYVICELNPAPGISLHTHPSFWEGRDLPKYLVDMLFPEISNIAPWWELINSNYKNIAELNVYFKNKYPGSYFYRPVHLELELTHKCNLLCPDCTIKDDIIIWEYGISNILLKKIFEEASNLWFYSYSFTGGEPFMRFEDMCDVINSTSKLDCYKIQTNWVIFSQESIVEKYLLNLKNSWFGSKNNYIKSSLRCSVGIQEKNIWVNFMRIKNLIDSFYKVFDSNYTDFAIILTHDFSKNQFEAVLDFKKRYYTETWDQFPSYIPIRSIFIHKREWIESSWIKSKILPILEKTKYSWNCFLYDDLPWPRLLVRANGDAYSCSCFWHNFKLWNIKNDSLENIIKNANENDIIQIIENKGVIWLYNLIKEKDRSVENIEVDENISICDICKILKDMY